MTGITFLLYSLCYNINIPCATRRTPANTITVIGFIFFFTIRNKLIPNKRTMDGLIWSKEEKEAFPKTQSL